MSIQIVVKKIQESNISLPFVYYYFRAQCLEDKIFLQIFINYKDMTIRLKQLFGDIHRYFENQLYFFISLKRNGCTIFEYKFFGRQQIQQQLLNVVHKFQVHDTMNIYHLEPDRLKVNLKGYNMAVKNNTFVFTNIGLQNVADKKDCKITLLGIEKVDKFNRNYNIDLSYNIYYKILFTHYKKLLISKDLKKNIPNNWID